VGPYYTRRGAAHKELGGKDYQGYKAAYITLRLSPVRNSPGEQAL